MKRKIFTLIGFVLLAATVALLVVGLSFSFYIMSRCEREIDESMFEALTGNTASKIYYYESEEARGRDSATELAGGELFGGFRSVAVSYEEIPHELIYAFVSIEDKRYFEHSGVDWKRTLGATLNYFLNFRSEFGGSTITQQLIKNVTEKDDYSFERKVQEILWALDLERKMSKEEIIESYLNIINLSNGCYGVGAASEYYFSKPLSELSLAECASIAAITNNPSFYDPVRNPKNNRARRDLILSEMLAQGYINGEEYNAAVAEDVQTSVARSGGGVHMWYTDMVVEDVINDLVAQKGYSRAMASHLIYTGGLNIYTAMDIDVQNVLEEYYKKESNFYPSGAGETPQSAMIIIHPESGDILGVAGAVGTKNANRLQNYATGTVRPAGSVIKPLSVYAPALETGIITYSTVYDDVPVNFGNYNLDASAGAIQKPVAWPKNANGVYRGLTNINYAIEHSVNTVTVKVLADLGLQNSFYFAKEKLKLHSLIEKGTLSDGSVITDMDYAALALGQFNYGVTLREITAAYSIFPNGGIYNNTRSYYRVTDSYGNTVLENSYRGERAISEENACVMTEMLKNVVSDGTATSVSLKKYIDCAGKTGTTQNNCDRWFIGFTPYYIGGVWYGYEYPKELPSSSKSVCVSVWDDIMTILHKKHISSGELKGFEKHYNVVEAEYCLDSGKLLGEACKCDPRGDRSEVGYFVKGTEPSESCDCHVLVPYDTDKASGGGVMSHECEFYNVKYVGLLRVERSFPMQIFVTDAQYTYRELPQGTQPETNPNLPFFANALSENSFSGISYGNTQFNRYCRAHFDYYKWKEENEGSSG